MVRVVGALVGVLMVACGSIYLALLVTPKQTVAAPGEPIRVGAVPPTLSVSGPAELAIDGNTVPTALNLVGPVRPLLQVSRHTINSLVARLEASPQHVSGLTDLGNRVEGAWVRYLVWELCAVALAAVLITGAAIGWAMLIRSRSPDRRDTAAGTVSRRRRRRLRMAGLFALAVLVAVGLDAAGLPMAPQTLGHVKSLSQLFGSNPVPNVSPSGPVATGVQAVVIGDSTAAGDGDPPMSHPSAEDTACHRSRDAYSVALAASTNWTVLNLACSGATIDQGLIGSQHVGDQVLPPQVARLKRVRSVGYVFVSIGANDLQMGAMVGACVALHKCNDQALGTLFQAELDAFTRSYSQLLQLLATLPSKPRVIVNQYYDGLGQGTCEHRLLDAGSIAFLRSWFDAMNRTLADGAALFGFASAHPDFTGHQLCDANPYVQKLSSPAPLHPNVSGELAIALVDLHAVAGIDATRALARARAHDQ